MPSLIEAVYAILLSFGVIIAVGCGFLSVLMLFSFVEKRGWFD